MEEMFQVNDNVLNEEGSLDGTAVSARLSSPSPPNPTAIFERRSRLVSVLLYVCAQVI